jgi:hypothetical protein
MNLNLNSLHCIFFVHTYMYRYIHICMKYLTVWMSERCQWTCFRCLCYLLFPSHLTSSASYMCIKIKIKVWINALDDPKKLPYTRHSKLMVNAACCGCRCILLLLMRAYRRKKRRKREKNEVRWANYSNYIDRCRPKKMQNTSTFQIYFMIKSWNSFILIIMMTTINQNCPMTSKFIHK